MPYHLHIVMRPYNWAYYACNTRGWLCHPPHPSRLLIPVNIICYNCRMVKKWGQSLTTCALIYKFHCCVLDLYHKKAGKQCPLFFTGKCDYLFKQSQSFLLECLTLKYPDSLLPLHTIVHEAIHEQYNSAHYEFCHYKMLLPYALLLTVPVHLHH